MTTTEKNEIFTEQLVEALENIKAQDILVIDVQGRCDFADRFVLATGRSNRQLKAMAKSVSEVAHRYEIPAKVEGLEAAEWLLVDLGDVIIHLFSQDARDSFQLERLWANPKGDTTAS